METIYFTTSNFIKHEGNMVDLTEYRRKLALAQGIPQEEPEEEPRPVRARTRRRSRSLLTGLMLDYAASAAIFVTALTFTLKIL